jgi:hypothetical protein
MYKFEIPEDQIERLETWKKHECECKDPSKQGAIGGRFTYEFIPTGIGVFVTVKCMCGSHIHLTDDDRF